MNYIYGSLVKRIINRRPELCKIARNGMCASETFKFRSTTGSKDQETTEE